MLTHTETAIKNLYDSDPSLQALGQDNPAIAKAINAMDVFDGQPLTINNPATRVTVPVPVTMAGLREVVGTDLVNMLNSPKFEAWAQTLLQGTPTVEQSNDVFTVLEALANSPQERNFIQVISFLVQVGDRESIKAFARLMASDGRISEANKDAVIAAVDGTIDDPNYPETIPNPNRIKVNEFQVHNALNY
jgi:hypothetical protein